MNFLKIMKKLKDLIAKDGIISSLSNHC